MSSHIIGHQRQKEIFSETFRSGRSHAFLFSGPISVGKHALAHAIAADLVEGETEFTWRRDVSRYGESVFVLAPERTVKKDVVKISKISIDAVREVSRQLMMATTEGSYNVLIIDEADQLNPAARNALLKILEEPPARTVFFLISHDPYRIGATVRSRTTMINFGTLSNVEMNSLSEDDELRDVAFGRPGMLVRAIEDVTYRETLVESVASLRRIQAMALHERLQYASEVSEHPVAALEMLSVWVMRIYSVAHERKMYQILSLTEKIEKARLSLRETNANKKLVLEELFISL